MSRLEVLKSLQNGYFSVDPFIVMLYKESFVLPFSSDNNANYYYGRDLTADDWRKIAETLAS